MKQKFFDTIIKAMRKNKDIYFISIGLGWPRTEELKQLFPSRFIQTEAAEQTALDIAVGLAYSGKIPITYTITPFYFRGYETIRTYIVQEKLHVIMVGAGRDDDYSKDDGFSHDASDIYSYMDNKRGILNINAYYPETEDQLRENIADAINREYPAFISLKR